MKVVNLYNEVTQESVQLSINNKDFKTLEYLQYVGGFKRFGISLYDEVKQNARQKKELLNFLNAIFSNHKLIESYF